MNNVKLKKILDKHLKWLKSENNEEMVNLYGFVRGVN